jgi:hypothetical protein
VKRELLSVLSLTLVGVAACGGSATLYEGTASSGAGTTVIVGGAFGAGGSVSVGAGDTTSISGSGAFEAGSGSIPSGGAMGIGGVAGGAGAAGRSSASGGALSGGGAPATAGSGGVSAQAGEAGESGSAKCLVDADCATNACDAVTRTCIGDACADHHQDGHETDADCGGGACSTCAIGQACAVDADCTLPACDGVSFLCVNNPCTDHRRDGNETDIDCGGGDSCLRCKPGQLCANSTDCRPGHMCSTTSPKVCL